IRRATERNRLDIGLGAHRERQLAKRLRIKAVASRHDDAPRRARRELLRLLGSARPAQLTDLVFEAALAFDEAAEGVGELAGGGPERSGGARDEGVGPVDRLE